MEPVPVAHELPKTVSEPELVVAFDELYMVTPTTPSVPFAVPVIVTLPPLVAEMLAFDFR